MLRRPLPALTLLLLSACTSSTSPDVKGSGDTAGQGAVGGGSGAGGTGGGGGASGAAGTGGGGTSGASATTGGSAGASAIGGTGTAGLPGTGGAGPAGSPGTGGSTAGTGIGGSSELGGAGTGGAAAGAGGTSGGTAGNGGAGQAGGASGGTSGGGSAGLATTYASYFPIGAAVDSQSYMTHAPVLKAHFNSVTPENEMKWDALENTEGTFTYSAADTIVNFATTNGMKVRGHTLVWHSQNPSWVFASATKDVLLARMKKHITSVMGHFKGKVYAWDVVNEAIMEDGTYRDGNETDDTKKSHWYEIIGESYIAEAFNAAHAADPDAKLFYNDYYDYLPAKQQGIYTMLKGLLDAGVPVNGVGMQCHLNIQPSTDSANQGYYQDVTHLEDAIKLYASLGLDVQVTELDMSLYVPGVTYTTDTYYTAATFTDALKQQQADRYAQFFELFRKYQGTITGVTFWGIADDNTWLSEFSSGRKDFPLLFDTNHDPKPAYTAVVAF